MSIVASITIQLWGVSRFSHTLAVLQDAGWDFPEGRIISEHFQNLEDDWNEETHPAAE